MRPAAYIVAALFLTCVIPPAALAQVPDPAAASAAPIPGAGHNYIGIANETVNPADGLISYNLGISPPAGRQLSIPFGIRYAATEQFYLSEYQSSPLLVWRPHYSESGWNYDLPVLTFAARVQSFTTTYTGQPPNGAVNHQCDSSLDYIFKGLDGVQYTTNLGFGWVDQSSTNTNPPTQCTTGQFVSTSSVHGITASTPNNWSGWPTHPPVTVVDQSGTTYQFGAVAGLNPSIFSDEPYLISLFPDTVTDRNGNQIKLTSPTPGFSDTLGRTVVSWTGFGTDGNQVSVSGLGSAITLHWATVPVTFPGAIHNATVSDPHQGTKINCSLGTSPTSSIKVVTEVDLPNAQKYTFTYDPNYGRVSKIKFPTGGYVRYVWGLNTSSTAALFSNFSQPQGNINYCNIQYDTPAVVDRYVSYDGSTEVLHQHFAYSTTWNSSQPWIWTGKATTVTTTDLVTSQVSAAIYNYTPGGTDQGGPYDTFSGNVPRTVPLESSVVYQDATAHTLKTSNKKWHGAYASAGEQTILDNGQGAAVLRCYDSNEQLTDVYEYGFQSEGAKPADPTCVSSSGLNASAIGPLRRHTVTAYHNFLGASPSTHIVNSPDSVTVYDGSNNRVKQTTFTYSESVVSSGTATGLVSPPGLRGNATTISHWLNTTGSSMTTSLTYFDTGSVNSSKDPCGNSACSDMTGASHTTTYSYTDNYSSCSGSAPPAGATNAYLTTLTDPLGHTQTFCYGYSDGQLRGSTDVNGKTTLYKYNDSLARLTETDFPDAGQATRSFNDPAVPPTVTSSRLLTTTSSPSQFITTVTTMDGLAHAKQSALTTDPDGATYTATNYDGLGRPFTVYNPTRCNPPTTNCLGESTWGFTTYTYDALGRVTAVTAPDGAVTTTSYTGNCAITTDASGKGRKSCNDSLGRLTQVVEDPASRSYETDYSYNALDDLLTVNQKGDSGSPTDWRPRTFTYDSISRLLTASNPESGTVSYTYDANGNLSTKTSPAPNQTGSATVTISYCYDVENRLLSKVYAGGQSCPTASPVATYVYDQTTYNGLTIANGIHHRGGMTDVAGAEAWSYDAMGRVTATRRTTNSVTKSTSYTYNLDGSPATIVYPLGGPVVTFTQGGAGRPTSETAPGFGLATSAQYAPNGNICSLKSAWGSYFTHIYTWNNRFQPDKIQLYGGGAFHTVPGLCKASTDATENWVDLQYFYSDSGHNNGNVTRILSKSAYAANDVSYGYDSLNRISTAQTVATASTNPTVCYGEQFGYDAWGNLKIISGSSSVYTGCTQENLSVTVNTKNQVSGNTYDAAGNLILVQPGGTAYTYDPENRLTSAGGQTYLYDGDGKRVEKASGGTANTLYWYGGGSQLLTETTGTGVYVHQHYYFQGMHLARTNSNNWVDHYGLDALGNTRYVYGQNPPGAGTWDSSEFYPFGGERQRHVGGTANNFKFSSKERDSESGLDNFGARYDSSAMGRFMSPDSPSYSNHKNPQSWNLYAFALNNPVTFRDTDGHKVECKDNVEQCRKDAAKSTGTVVQVQRVQDKPSWLQRLFNMQGTIHNYLFIPGDTSGFAPGSNAAKLAGLIADPRTVTVDYTNVRPGTNSEMGAELHGGSDSRTPSQSGQSIAWIDPTRTQGAAYDRDALNQGLPQSTTAEEFAHEVLGHIWGELLGGAPALTRANMRDSIIGENAVRALDPTRGQKGLESHHNYQEATPDPPKKP